MEYEKRKLKPGQAKSLLGKLWFEGVEDLLNGDFIKSEKDLAKYYNMATKKDLNRFENDWSEEQFNRNIGKLFKLRDPNWIDRRGQDLKSAANFVKEKGKEAFTEGTNTNKVLFGEDAGQRGTVDLSRPDQIAYQQRMLPKVETSLNQYMQELHNPIQAPQQSQLGMNTNNALNALTGPALTQLLSQPNPNMFTGQFASQLPYQDGQSGGIGALLGALGGPLLQQLLNR